MFCHRLVVVVVWVVWIVGLISTAAGMSANMSRFQSLIEPETCASKPKSEWFRYESIGSLFVRDTELNLFYQQKDQTPFILSYSLGQEFRTKPIHHISLIDDYNKHLTMSKSYHRELIVGYLERYNITSYYPVSDDYAMFVIDTEDQMKDTVLTYAYSYKPRILSLGTIEKGSIPLLHLSYKDYKYFDIHKPMPITLINNRQFTYQTAHYTASPVSIKIQQTYYYAFNKRLDRIYFAKHFKQLESIPNFLHPQQVIDNPHWHPFLVSNYIYLQVSEWLLIFPYLNLTEQTISSNNNNNNNNSPIEASLMVMHRNTFFRCSVPSGLKQSGGPVYPSPEFRRTLVSGSVEQFLSSQSVFQKFPKLSTLTQWALFTVVIAIVMFDCAIVAVIINRKVRSSRFVSGKQQIGDQPINNPNQQLQQSPQSMLDLTTATTGTKPNGTSSSSSGSIASICKTKTFVPTSGSDSLSKLDGRKKVEKNLWSPMNKIIIQIGHVKSKSGGGGGAGGGGQTSVAQKLGQNKMDQIEALLCTMAQLKPNPKFLGKNFQFSPKTSRATKSPGKGKNNHKALVMSSTTSQNKNVKTLAANKKTPAGPGPKTPSKKTTDQRKDSSNSSLQGKSKSKSKSQAAFSKLFGKIGSQVLPSGGGGGAANAEPSKSSKDTKPINELSSTALLLFSSSNGSFTNLSDPAVISSGKSSDSPVKVNLT